MKKILFPTDFSPVALNAYKYAVEFAKITGVSIDLLHVYPFPVTGTEEYLHPIQMEVIIRERERQVNKKMKAFCEQYPFNNIGKKITRSSLFEEQVIIDQSKEDDYDLIIMGTKGERNPVTKLMGSITTRTMMNAGCPVLAIPENAKFTGIKQMTYATTFSSEDKHFSKELMQFGEKVKAKVDFLHISADPESGAAEKILMPDYSDEFVNFSVVSNPSVMEGVDEFIRKNKVDVLALYIPKRGLWERLFHTSFSKKMTFHTEVPLLVFHG